MYIFVHSILFINLACLVSESHHGSICWYPLIGLLSLHVHVRRRYNIRAILTEYFVLYIGIDLWYAHECSGSRKVWLVPKSYSIWQTLWDSFRQNPPFGGRLAVITVAYSASDSLTNIHPPLRAFDTNPLGTFFPSLNLYNQAGIKIASRAETRVYGLQEVTDKLTNHHILGTTGWRGMWRSYHEQKSCCLFLSLWLFALGGPYFHPPSKKPWHYIATMYVIQWIKCPVGWRVQTKKCRTPPCSNESINLIHFAYCIFYHNQIWLKSLECYADNKLNDWRDEWITHEIFIFSESKCCSFCTRHHFSYIFRILVAFG